MTNYNTLLTETYKTSNILPIVFDCSSLINKEKIKDYLISENELAVFLDIDDFEVESLGEDNSIYHNIFTSSNNVIDINSKRPFLRMLFRQSDYNLYLAIEEIILNAFKLNRLIEIKDYHFLKKRSLLVKSLKINGGVNRLIQEEIDPVSLVVSNIELRHIPNGFTMTAIENTFTII